MVEGLSSLKAQLTAKLLEEATKSARQGHYLDATAKFGQSGARPGEQLLHASYLAYAFYRRALTHQSELDETRAIEDLETARQFPGLSRPLRSLIQQRLTTIQKEPDIEIRRFDRALAEQFDRTPTDVELRGEFLRRFGLSQAKRNRSVEGIDEISSIGVYRWVGDTNRNEQWSQLIRKFKKGESGLPGFFGRILAEHVRAVRQCARRGRAKWTTSCRSPRWPAGRPKEVST